MKNFRFELVLNDNLEVTQISKPLVEFTGWSPGEILQRRDFIEKLIPGDDQEIFIARYEHLIHGRHLPADLTTVRRRCKTKDGNMIRVILDDHTPMLSQTPSGKILYYNGIFLAEDDEDHLCRFLNTLDYVSTCNLISALSQNHSPH